MPKALIERMYVYIPRPAPARSTRVIPTWSFRDYSNCQIQDSFEDANDTNTRETSPAPNMERTRSLTKQPSVTSIPQDIETEPTPPLPSLPTSPEKETNGDSKDEIEEDHTQSQKSPLLTAHRPSISSVNHADLDTVSLDEGPGNC